MQQFHSVAAWKAVREKPPSKAEKNLLHMDATANYKNWNKSWKQQGFFQESDERVKLKSSEI